MTPESEIYRATWASPAVLRLPFLWCRAGHFLYLSQCCSTRTGTETMLLFLDPSGQLCPGDTAWSQEDVSRLVAPILASVVVTETDCWLD